MKKRQITLFKLLFSVCLLLFLGCENDIAVKDTVSSGEVESRSSDNYTPATDYTVETDPTDRISIQANGMNFIATPAILNKFEPSSEIFSIETYFVSEAGWTEGSYEKIYYLISKNELSKEKEIQVITSFLNEEDQVATGFSGAIAVLDINLNPEGVRVYGEAFSNSTEEDIAYRIEHVAAGFDGPGSIEERNAGGCFIIYLVEYGVSNGYVYNSWPVGFFCVGTGSGGLGNSPASSEPSGGGITTTNDETNSHADNQNCDFAVEIGRFAGPPRS